MKSYAFKALSIAAPFGRRFVVANLLIGSAVLPARAQDVLYVAGYGGSSEAVIKEHILAPFAEKHQVKIEYVAGTSAANLARLQAQQGNPEIDLAILDDGPMQQAVSLGLCRPVEPFPALDKLYELAKANGDGQSLGIGIVATGLAYNREEFERKGWPAPTSWTDLANPTFEGKVLVPSITNSYGLHSLLALSKALNAPDGDIDPAFTYMTDKVAPNVFSFETSSGKISELFQTSEVLLGVWGSGRAQALAKSGFPVAFVTPKEGTVALQTTICPVAGSDVPDLAQLLLREFFTPEAQAILAREAGWGPSNSATVLEPEVAASVTYGEAAVSQLIPVDWKAVNAKRADWTKRWTREVER